tara:strand:- start:44 stop:508 length:465 start_codon:yes stop_codon:yes gene_type:complete
MSRLFVWDKRFLDSAEHTSRWSKDPSTKVGAVIVDEERRVVSVGYNGFPKGVDDNCRLDNREEKYKIIVHAECNAVLFAQRNLEGCTIYTYPFMPCPTCAGIIIQSGIERVVSYANTNKRWENDFKISRSIFSEAGVRVVEYTKGFFEQVDIDI